MVLNKIQKRTRRLYKKIHNATVMKFGVGLTYTHSYHDYDEYVNHQKEKTANPVRVKQWLNEAWAIKLDNFKDIFERNEKYVGEKQKAICLGARTGQEVKALLDMGKKAVGIDLVPFDPYTIEGDIHNLQFEDDEFDLVFTNIFDHALKPDVFCAEMERVCQPGGVIIMHLQLRKDGDQYSENILYNQSKVIELFKNVIVKENRKIRNTYDKMNWELILEKV